MSYGAFLARVPALAGAMRHRLMLQPGARIGIAMKNCPQYLETMFAGWHAGLCVVPINAKLHPKEIAFILRHSEAMVCFATSDLAEELTGVLDEVPTLGRIISVDDDEYRNLFASDDIPRWDASYDDPAWLFYTSGTTGRPKGAVLTHRSLTQMSLRYYADIDNLTEEDCILHAAPLSHGSGLYALPHIAKASHQIIPAGSSFDPAEIVALTHLYENMTFMAAPTMLTRLARYSGMGSAKLESIRTIFYGGAPMYVQDLKHALSVIGPRLLQAYGQGEMPNTLTFLPKRMHLDASHPRYAARLGSVGIARTGVDIRIVGEDGHELPPGEIGEVTARSDVCMLGYWRDPDATRKAIRNGWLHTGDLGMMEEDGLVTLKDRSKDLIISGGSNIYPREIEEILLTHPGVSEAAIIGRAHPDWGEEVVAVVAPLPGRALNANELDQLCLRHIARFKRPKEYYFIDELPKSNYGKILKRDLRDQVRSLKGVRPG